MNMKNLKELDSEDLWVLGIEILEAIINNLEYDDFEEEVETLQSSVETLQDLLKGSTLYK